MDRSSMIMAASAAIGFALGLGNKHWWWAPLSQVALLTIVLLADGALAFRHQGDLFDFVGFNLFLLGLPATIAWIVGNVLYLTIRWALRRAH